MKLKTNQPRTKSVTGVCGSGSGACCDGEQSGSLKICDHRDDVVEASPRKEEFPAAVHMVLSALDAGASALQERRRRRRISYRMRAQLRLFSDQPGTEPWVVYTRDIDQRGVGFVTPHRLPLGYAGHVELEAPDGQRVRVHCTLVRCREAAPGWYEGAAYFNREQHEFASG